MAIFLFQHYTALHAFPMDRNPYPGTEHLLYADRRSPTPRGDEFGGLHQDRVYAATRQYTGARRNSRDFLCRSKWSVGCAMVRQWHSNPGGDRSLLFDAA